MCCVGNKGKSNIFPSNLLQAIIITLLRSVCVWPVYTVSVHACLLDHIAGQISQQCHSYVAVTEERGATRLQSVDFMNAAPTDVLIWASILYPLKSFQLLFLFLCSLELKEMKKISVVFPFLSFPFLPFPLLCHLPRLFQLHLIPFHPPPYALL